MSLTLGCWPQAKAIRTMPEINVSRRIIVKCKTAKSFLNQSIKVLPNFKFKTSTSTIVALVE